MTTETTHKIRKALFARFRTLGLTDTRHDVVFNFTGGRTSSTRELKPWEMAELVEKLGGPKFSDPDDYKWGMLNNREFFIRRVIDEVWLFGDHVSLGMATEIALARKFGIPVKSMSESIKL